MSSDYDAFALPLVMSALVSKGPNLELEIIDEAVCCDMRLDR